MRTFKLIACLLFIAAPSYAQTFSVSPTSVAEGTVAASTTAQYQVVTVTNTGGANLTFSAIQFTGTNAADFTFTDGFDHNHPAVGVPTMNCVNGEVAVDMANGAVYTCSGSTPGVSGTWSLTGSLNTQVVNPVGGNTNPMCVPGIAVAPSASCVIAIDFTPSTAGAKTASLQFTDNASGSPHTVALTGTGVAASGTSLNTTGCGSLLAASTTYILTANLNCNDAGFGLNGQNIIVNLNGFTLTCGASPSVANAGRWCFYNAGPGDGGLSINPCPIGGPSAATCNSGTTATTAFGGNEEIENGTITVASGATTSATRQFNSAAVYVGPGANHNPWKLHNLTINIPNQCTDCEAYGGFRGINSTLDGIGDLIWKVTVNDQAGFVFNRCEQEGYPFILTNTTTVSPGATAWENTTIGSPQGAFDVTTAFSILFGNYTAIGNANGSSAGTMATCSPTSTGANGSQFTNDYFSETRASHGAIINNVVNNLQGRGIDLTSPASGTQTGLTSQGNDVATIGLPDYSEYGGCEIGGGYAGRFDVFGNASDTNQTVVNDNYFVESNQCEGLGYSLSSSASTTNSMTNVKATCVLVSGHAAVNCIGIQNILNQYGNAALFTSTSSTFTGDTMDVFIGSANSGLVAGPWACYSCTFPKPTTAAAGKCGSMTESSWVFLSFCLPGLATNKVMPANYFIDPAFTGGASESSNDFALATANMSAGDSASYYILFTYTVTVKNSLGALISGATVTATDNQGGTSNALGNAYSCTTNGAGQCSIVLNENQYSFTAPSAPVTTAYNPITFKILAPGFPLLTYSATISATTTATETLPNIPIAPSIKSIIWGKLGGIVDSGRTERAYSEVNEAIGDGFHFDIYEPCSKQSFLNRGWYLNGFNGNLPVREVEQGAIDDSAALISDIYQIAPDQRPSNPTNGHFSKVQCCPETPARFQYAIDFTQRLRNIHVRQRHAGRDQIETGISKWEVFSPAACERHRTRRRDDIGGKAFFGNVGVIGEHAVFAATEVQADPWAKWQPRGFWPERSE